MILRQIAAVFQLELKKTFLSRRGWWIYFLAAGPVALTILHWLVSASIRGAGNHTLGDDSEAYAGLFQIFYLRGAIFFGCVGIFSNLFRGEMLEKTLHYYYMTPVRREALAAGKFLAGLAVSVTVFCTSVALAFLTIGRHAGHAYSDYIWNGPGLGQLEWYVVIAALACVGYGSVFLMCGLRYGNPMIPAAVVFVWENLNPFLPAFLKKISIFFYLKTLLPVDLPVTGFFSVIVVEAEPVAAWIAISGLLAVAGLILGYTALIARQTEISYGAE